LWSALGSAHTSISLSLNDVPPSLPTTVNLGALRRYALSFCFPDAPSLSRWLPADNCSFGVRLDGGTENGGMLKSVKGVSEMWCLVFLGSKFFNASGLKIQLPMEPV
jgi:hypothetical protein